MARTKSRPFLGGNHQQEFVSHCLLSLPHVPHTEGEEESWWMSGPEEMFGSALTAATSAVLRSELSSCKDLLDMEPDNKCEFFNDVLEVTTGDCTFVEGTVL